MKAGICSSIGIRAEDRWEPRSRAACVFCARTDWKEGLFYVTLAGDKCFMANQHAVSDLLHCRSYAKRWPDIPEDELRCSAVSLCVGTRAVRRRVLLHKRRVDAGQANGDAPVFVCSDCHAAFSPWTPILCNYALPNDLWIGRWHPILRRSTNNLSH